MYNSVCMSLFTLLTVRGILCSCPQLQPNPHVIVSCSVSTTESHALKCVERNTATVNKTEIPAGTTVEYKCDKYFKPVNNRHNNGGTLNCTEDGTWTNLITFQDFYCKIDCGKQTAPQNKLISGGNSTNAENWPWVATIFRQTYDGLFKYSCGGTLIGQKTILTAAHCVTDLTDGKKLPSSIFQVLVGTFSSSFEENAKEGRVQFFLVKEIHVYPDYRAETFLSDVALVELTEPVILSETIHPICLPRNYKHDTTVIRHGNIGEITSFGIAGTGQLANFLQHAHIPISTSSRCHNVINVIPHGDQYCAGDPTGPNICIGDSGSGLIFKSTEWNEDKYYVHGIVSNTGELANGCAPMVVFTKVFSYISWIEEKLVGIENLVYLRKIKVDPPKMNRKRLRPPAGLYTRTERRALTQLRPMVKTILLEDYMHEDKYLIRFLRTKKLDLPDTKDALQTTMEWRKANRMNEILHEDFTEFRKDFPAFADTFDKDGRPVFLGLVRFWDFSKVVHSTKLEGFHRYMLRNYEMAEERIRAVNQPNITQVVIIHDYDGFSASKHLCRLCLRMAASVNTLFETHFPQQFYLWYIINAPTIAERIVEAFPFFTEHFLSTTRVFGTNKTEWSAELLKQIPADQLYRVYGGTKSIKEGTKRIQLAF